MTQMLKPAIEVMVGIPSVVYGWLGLTLLVPLIRTHTARRAVSAWRPPGSCSAIMILPTVITLSEDAFRSLPGSLKEGSLALGATRWQTITRGCFRAPRAACGRADPRIARAVSETLEIQMVIRKRDPVRSGFFAPTAALTTEIVTDMPGATEGSSRARALSMALLLL